MRIRTGLIGGTVAATALLLASASPALAAVGYSTTTFAVANGSGPIAVDSSTLRIYAATSRDDDASDTHGILGLAVLDGTTRKVTATIPVNDGIQSYYASDEITDIQVNPRTHTIWVTAAITGEYLSGSWIVEIDGTTNKLVHSWTTATGAIHKISIDPGSNLAYAASSSTYEPIVGDDGVSVTSATLQSTGSVYSFNGGTGAMTSALLPSPATVPCGHFTDADANDHANTVTFNQANYAVLVAGTGKVWSYTNKLKLSHTTKLTASACDDLGTASDTTTNTNYVNDGTSLTTLSGATGAVTKTTRTAASGTPVIDTGVKTLYIGTGAYSTSTLARTGTLPASAVFVNGSSHTIYSSKPGSGILIKRVGA